MNKNIFSNQRSQQENEREETDSHPSVFDLQFSNPIRRLGRRNRSTATLKPLESQENLAPQFPSNVSENQTHPVNPGAASSFLTQLGKNNTNIKPTFPHAQSVEKIVLNNINSRNVEQCKKNLNYDPSIKTPDKHGSMVNQDILAARKKYPFLVSSSQDKENVVPINDKFKEPSQPKNVFMQNKTSSDQVDALHYILKKNLPSMAASSAVDKSNGLYPNHCFQTHDKYKRETASASEDIKPVIQESVPPAHEQNVFKNPSLPNKPLDLSPPEKTENNSDSSQDSSCFETAVMSASKLNFESPLDLSSHSTHKNISKSCSSMEVTNMVDTLQYLDMGLQNSELHQNPCPTSQKDILPPKPVVNSLPSQSQLPSSNQSSHHQPQEVPAHPQQSLQSTPVRPTSEPQSTSQQKNESTPVFKRPLSMNSYKQATACTPHDHSQETVRQKPQSEPVVRTQPKKVTAPPPILKKPAAENSQDMITVNEKQYQVLGLLGKGGSSSVYIVRETADSEFKPLALKVVNLSTITDQSTADGYLNEVELLAKLQGCPCVITMHDYEYETLSKHLYVLMEKGDSDLSKYMRNINKMTTIPNTMILIIKHWYEMLLAVKEIHAAGIIHSDLKPANFLFVGGVLKIIDFGIASSLQEDMTSVYKDIASGTLNYMSPEAIGQGNGSGSNPYRITYKSDVWSLGCILFNMIYGRTPYSHITNTWAKIQAIVDQKYKIEFKTHLSNNVAVPPTLLQSMKLCLQKDQKERPTVVDLLKIVESRLTTF